MKNRFFPLVVFSSFLFISCAGVPALKTEIARNAVRARYLYDFFPEWRGIDEGIDICAGRIKNPRLKFWALRVDLSKKFDAITLTPPAPSGAPPLSSGKIYSTTVSGFAKANGCIAAINAGPFSPVNSRIGEERTVIGVFAADGSLIAPPYSGFDALVFYQNGKTAIVRQAELATDGRFPNTVRDAAGGFHIVLWDGAVDKAVFSRAGRHPRSAAGLSADGRYLYLLAIDGRWFDTIGATEAETGLLLRALGASNGLNLDGGGSTALALRIEGKVVILNRPIHKQIPGKERAVATCIGVR
jgi:hypothetical protein